MARDGFEACVRGPDGDPPAQVFLERLERLGLNPPADDWGGIWHAHSK